MGNTPAWTHRHASITQRKGELEPPCVEEEEQHDHRPKRHVLRYHGQASERTKAYTNCISEAKILRCFSSKLSPPFFTSEDSMFSVRSNTVGTAII